MYPIDNNISTLREAFSLLLSLLTFISISTNSHGRAWKLADGCQRLFLYSASSIEEVSPKAPV